LAQPEWVLLNGQPVDFIGAFALMDNKLRAQLQTELAPCSTQVFMDAYAAAHRAKFGKEFGVMTSLSR
jgi:3-phosphoglycerate kinase